MIKNKSILITGAAGFIGSHLTEVLLQNGNFLILVDNFNKYYKGKEEQLHGIIKNYKESEDYKLIRGDLLDISIFDEIDDFLDMIFHLAAQAGVRYSIEHPVEVSRNNIISTINIFEFALKINTLKRLIFASSSSVYGNPIYTPCDEEHPRNPISPYALSKLAGELYAYYYYTEKKLPITTLRFYTVYGPRGRPDMAIRTFFNKMIRNKEILVYSNGEQIRDFTYVTDIVNGLILAGKNEKAVGEIFNLGYSSPISINELINKMYKITDKPKKIKFVDKQKGDVDITHSNIKKAREILNYNPRIKIDEGLRKQYEWQTKLLSLK